MNSFNIVENLNSDKPVKKIRRIQNKENEILIEEFCLYNDSECQISDIVIENEL